jgi:hypothetical protein
MMFRPRHLLFAVATTFSVTCASGPQSGASQPVIQFTTVPEAGSGGSERMVRIAGRVTGAAPGQRIVLFARAGVWWVQPTTAEPFTIIRPDSTWESSTHLGTEYAALLVDATFRPPDTAEALPGGSSVLAVATVTGTGIPPGSSTMAPKVLTFSGYEWEVRRVPSDRGGQNEYDPANAWTDAEGRLHLKLAHRDGAWTSAEVILTRSLGYGTYAFTVRDTSAMDPAAAFGMLTWDDEGADQNHREMAVEISQWGDPGVPNAQFVVQPYYVPANVARFAAPKGTLTHSFRWEPGRASFRTARGTNARGADVVAQHVFTSGIPTPGGERVHFNLYRFRYAPRPPQGDVEVVIERFQYLP